MVLLAIILLIELLFQILIGQRQTKNLLIDNDSILILEHFKKLDFNNILEFKESRSYGDSTFSFFKQNINFINFIIFF